MTFWTVKVSRNFILTGKYLMTSCASKTGKLAYMRSSQNENIKRNRKGNMKI